jgi:signal transduction histidine kinase
MNIHNESMLTEDTGNKYLEAVRSRIKEKIRDFATYNFTPPQSSAINIFFDLAQEFDSIAQLHALPVLILHIFFQYKAELYLKNERTEIALVTPPVAGGLLKAPQPRAEAWSDKGRYYFPVPGKHALHLADAQHTVSAESIMGVLVLYVEEELESHSLLFLKKFANRLGFCLHNKFLAERNSRHVFFLRKLSHDIGHNVITPNLRLKFQLNQLGGQITALGELSKLSADEATMQDIRIVHKRVAGQLKDIADNFQNSALFLESLLRQSHFDLGHYVLHRSRLDIALAVVVPQFNYYRLRLEELGLIKENAQAAYPDTPCMVYADLGLISQVMANFLSNAAKYSTPAQDGSCEVRCEVEVLPDAFENGFAGIKVSVFSSGPNIPANEAELLFEDNYRATNSTGQQGTGHGLFFVREIIREHKGRTGYEPLPGGNSFYFILPGVE